MENIKRNVLLKQKRRKQKQAIRQSEIICSSHIAEENNMAQSLIQFPTQHKQKDLHLRKSVSLQITNLDTSDTTYVDEQNLEQYSQALRFDTLENISVSEEFLYSKTNEQKKRDQFGLACQKGDIDTLKKYIQTNDVDINILFQDDRNGLHLAINSNKMSLKSIVFLLDHGINIDKQNRMGRTPLILAVIKSNKDICKLLIQRKCQLDIQDMYGNTALHYACIYGWFNITKILLTSQANVEIKNNNKQIPEQCCGNGQVFKLFNKKSQYSRTVLDQHMFKNSRNDHIQKILDKAEQSKPFQVQLIQQSPKLSESTSKTNKWKSKLQMFQNLLKHESFIESTIKSNTSDVSLLDFKCIDVLGKGSFGQVYLVQHYETKEMYAMKVLNKSQIRQNKLLPYVQMQRKILSMVRHPFIVGLHYAFQTYDKLILVMTYCPGGDLLQLTKKLKQLDEDLIKKYAAEIILGIECLHKAEIIYRDLKPANVVLDKDGHACITDFGLAKQSQIGHSFCGSMAYLAPQMLNRRGHTRTIDWYLLGVLIYECYTGKPPFWDTTRDKLILNIKSGIYIPFEASDEMKDIISKLLIADKTKRLGSGPNGADEIKAHPWFNDIDWNQVSQRKLIVPKSESSTKINSNTERKQLFTKDDIQKGLIDRVQNWQYCID